MRLFHVKKASPETAPAFYMAGMQAMFWLSWSFSCYWTVYLQQNGFTTAQMGVLCAIMSAVAIFATIAWGAVSDLINSSKKTFFFCLLGMELVFAVIPFIPVSQPNWVPMMFVVFPVLTLFRGCIGTQIDNYSIRLCAQEGIHYGAVRALGSGTFAVMSIFIADILAKTGVAAAFWISGLIAIPALLFLALGGDPKVPNGAERAAKRQKLSLKELFREPYYMAFLIFAVFLYLPVTGEGQYFVYLMDAVGIPTSEYGTLLSVRAFLEMPFLLLGGRLCRRFRLQNLVMLAAGFMALECFAECFLTRDQPTMMIYGSLFGLGNGLFMSSAPQYVLRLAPARLKATAQSVFASVASVSAIVGNLAGGFLFQILGARTFYGLLGVLFLAAILIFALSFVLLRGRPNPADAAV